MYHGAKEEEEEFTLTTAYCNIHGQHVDVLESENGDKYVSLTDVRKSGFQIFRKDKFKASLVDPGQINKEFDLHMLSAAKEYILENCARLGEKDILKAIENCRNNILGNTRPPPSQLLPTRKVSQNSANLQVTRTFNEPAGDSYQSNNNDFTKMHNARSPRSGDAGSDNDAAPGTSRGRPHQQWNNQRNKDSGQYQDFDPRDRRGGNNNRDQGGLTNGYSRGRQSLDNHGRTNSDDRRKGRHSFDEQGNRSQFDDGRKGRQSFEEQGNRSQGRGMQRKGPNFGSRDNDSKFGGGVGRFSNSKNDDTASVSDTASSTRANPGRREFIPSTTLDENESYKVRVCHIEKNNIYWVHLEEITPDFEKNQKEMQLSAPGLETLEEPHQAQLLLALFDGVWYRGRVYNEEPLLVHFLDTGFRNKPEEMKVLPAQFKKHPAFGIRMVINSPEALEKNIIYDITVKKKYEGGTYVADRSEIQNTRSRAGNSQNADRFRARSADPKKNQKTENGEKIPMGQKDRSRSRSTGRKKDMDDMDESWDKTSPPLTQVFIKVPAPLESLKDGDVVLFCGIDENTFYMRTKECCTRLKKLVEHIKQIDKSAKSGLQSVKKDQLVLCSKEDYPSLCRANICDIDGNIVRVKYVDFPGEDQLSIKSLRNVDSFLANEAKLLLESPVCSYLDNLDLDVLQFIEKLVQEKAKMTVVLEGGDFDLEMKDETLLSEKIKNFSKANDGPEQSSKPKNDDKSKDSKNDDKQKDTENDEKPKDAKAKKSEPEIKKTAETNPVTTTNDHIVEEAPIFYEEMTMFKPQLGENQYLVYSINALDDITIISQELESLEHFQKISPIEVDSTEPYTPEETELCLVKLLEEGQPCWYRAIMVGTEGEDEFSVICLDFGNQATVKSSDLRKFPSEFKDTPILGIPCTWTEVPHEEKVLKKLKELVDEGESVEIIVEEFDKENEKYKIKMPEIYQKMVDAGLV